MGISQSQKLVSKDTDAAFSVNRDTVSAGFRAPLHVHHSHSETFTILDGSADVRIGDKTQTVSGGACVHIPKGVAHSVQVEERSLEMWTVVEPGGFQGLSRELAALTDPHPSAVAEILARYDPEFLEPPGP
jgi:mannose-6-phosphate isomerase-like protein (cupin superfamily)